MPRKLVRRRSVLSTGFERSVRSLMDARQKLFADFWISSANE